MSNHRATAWLCATVGGVACALGAVALAQQDEAKAITLTIDFANGFEMRYALEGLDDDATVLDVMVAARSHARPLELEYKGEGRSAFLMSIEGVENELAGPASKNWLYWVNDEFAKRGMGAMPVADGDIVLWRFGQWEDAKK